MKRIGLIDVDGHNYPNLPLMKLSAYHKSQGDSVEWYDPMFSGHMDRVYLSKVFSFSDDYEYCIDADEVIKGGSGYCIRLENGKEVFDKSKDIQLPYEIEHIYPDYDLYGVKDVAYGFLTRGCPRGCHFCIVKEKEGRCAYKVADLSEFWNGQKKIVLLDPNILACKERKELLNQLINSKAKVDFNQGLDVRFMDDEAIEMLNKIKCEKIHFAFDRYQDKDLIVPKFEKVAEKLRYNTRSINVYVLTNFDTTIEQDLERIYILRSLGFSPYVMRYNKEFIPRGSIYNKLARWVNYRAFFWRYNTLEEYLNAGV